MLGNFNVATALQLAGANLPSTANTSGMSANLLILDAIIPGFSIVRELFLNYFKYDITSLVTRTIFVAVVLRTGKYLEYKVKNLLLQFCCSSVTISPKDRLHGEITGWMAAYVMEKGSRHKAASSWKKDRASNDSFAPMWAGGPRRVTRNVNQADFDETTPPVKYTPTIGTQWFWFSRRPFMFRKCPNNPKHPDMEGDIVVYALGRNFAPLMRFIQTCKDHEKETRTTFTTLRVRRPGGWSGAILKSNRPLDTIDFDAQLKAELLEDIKTYLHPTARRSYGRRGIPYRRGYLFYGPPGTGKTSMCFALAGHFKLELYSLSGQGLSDAELEQLFDCLPPKCIVLLEDIDSAGITREHSETKMKDKETGPKLLPGYGPERNISLSGLLNSIDGANAQEGRILIMTTNTPEKLDKALIRPGRIDKQIYFGPISRKCAEAIFIRMFSKDESNEEEHGIWLVDKNLTEAELMDLAVAFSNKIPEGRLTPAEIQGFLVNTKDPRKSVLEVDAWIAKTLESRDDAKAFKAMEAGPPKDTPKANGTTIISPTANKDAMAGHEMTETSPKLEERGRECEAGAELRNGECGAIKQRSN